MYVITGATGHTGKIAAETLLAAGKKVRVLVRNADKAKDLASRGAEVAIGDFADQASLARAFAGATGVYLLSPPDMATNDFFGERIPLLQTVARTAAVAKVPHVVFLSSIGAEKPAGTGPIVTLHAGEEALRKEGVPSTFVRAGYFLENWASVLPVAKKDGVLPSFLPANFSIFTVGTLDIGRTVAQALIDGPRGPARIIELFAPVETTPTDIAKTVGRVLGREIKVVEAPLEAVVPTFTSFGISANMAGHYRDMYAAFISGQVVRQPDAEVIRGTETVEASLRRLLG